MFDVHHAIFEENQKVSFPLMKQKARTQKTKEVVHIPTAKGYVRTDNMNSMISKGNQES